MAPKSFSSDSKVIVLTPIPDCTKNSGPLSSSAAAHWWQPPSARSQVCSSVQQRAAVGQLLSAVDGPLMSRPCKLTVPTVVRSAHRFFTKSLPANCRWDNDETTMSRPYSCKLTRPASNPLSDQLFGSSALGWSWNADTVDSYHCLSPAGGGDHGKQCVGHLCSSQVGSSTDHPQPAIKGTKMNWWYTCTAKYELLVERYLTFSMTPQSHTLHHHMITKNTLTRRNGVQQFIT